MLRKVKLVKRTLTPESDKSQHCQAVSSALTCIYLFSVHNNPRKQELLFFFNSHYIDGKTKAEKVGIISLMPFMSQEMVVRTQADLAPESLCLCTMPARNTQAFWCQDALILLKGSKDSKQFCLCALYVLIFIVFKIKTKKFKIYFFINSFKNSNNILIRC